MKLALLFCVVLAAAAFGKTLRDDISVSHLSDEQFEVIRQSLGPIDCGVRSNEDGYTQYYCKLDDLNPGEALLDLIGDNLPDLNINLNFAALVPSSYQSNWCISGYPDQCVTISFPFWSDQSFCVSDVIGDCIGVPIGLGTLLNALGSFEVDLSLGFVQDIVEKAFKILDYLPLPTLEVNFNLCSFEIEFVAYWGSIVFYRRSLALPPPYNKYTPESIYNSGAQLKCFAESVKGFGAGSEFALPTGGADLLRTGVSLRICPPDALMSIFGGQSFCLDLGNFTVSETGAEFCPKGIFRDVINSATDSDYPCVEFGNADKCAQHNGECGTCVATDGCSWCSAKNSCRGDELVNYLVDPCGGCPGDLTEECPSEVESEEELAEYKDRVVIQFERADLNRDQALTLVEYTNYITKWAIRPTVTTRSFSYLDVNGDGIITLAEFGFRLNPNKYREPTMETVVIADRTENDIKLRLPHDHPMAHLQTA